MTTPSEREDEILAAMFEGRVESSGLADKDFSETFAAYQQVEALFDLLRQPSTVLKSQVEADLAPGKALGEFVILRPLASGGMGHVYLARQESLFRFVALKVCKPEIARDPRMKRRFMAEALSLAQLTHPNVVPVLSSGEHQGYLYLAMEYVSGPTLAQVLLAIQGARPDSLASSVVAQVLAGLHGVEQNPAWGGQHARLDRAYQTWIIQTLQQIAQGLAAAHSSGILHRDIKPANIVFGANGVPKIVDFGLARTTQMPSTTVIGEFYGTPAYTSPEQARGDVDGISPATDVFSFGVTLFECLSLDRPFLGRTSADVLSAVLNSDPPLLRQVEKRMPWELEAITDKCLRKHPADRYTTAQAIAEDLRNYLELRPVTARSTSKIGRVGRMIRRQPWVAAFLFSLMSATVLGAILAKNAWVDYQAEKRKALEDKQAEKLRDFAKQVDAGDVALFRCLSGQRPTWLPAVIEQHRQKGISEYSAALEFDPDAVWPLVQRARLYEAKKESLDLALADLDRALQLRPGFGSVHKLRGYVLDELGRKEEGRVAREESKKLYPTAADDLYWLGVIAHSKEQEFVASYDYFSRALLLAPNDYWSRLERAYFGRIASEENVRLRVIPELDIAKTIRPDLPFASELLVHFYATDRSHGNAIDQSREKKELTEQIERFGLDILRAHKMSQLLQTENRYDEAQTILRKVLDQDSGGRTAEQLGDLKYRMGHYDQAREWYHRAISEGAKYPVVYMRLANACSAQKDWKAAEKTYLDGISEQRENAFLYHVLGSWFVERDRITDAENIYRKGCELPCDDNSSSRSLAEYSGQVSDIFHCYQSLTYVLGKSGRLAERVQMLERGITQFEKNLVTTNQLKKKSIEEHISQLKGLLIQTQVYADRRRDAVSLIDAELKKKPLNPINVNMLVSSLNLLGMQQAALDTARLAEYTTSQDVPTNDHAPHQLVRSVLDGQLQRMGLFKELFDRLETRRALGEELSVEEYGWFIFHKGPQVLKILGEGVKKYPDSVLLHTYYMQLLAGSGRTEEAWKAYERARELYFSHVGRSGAPALPIPLQSIELPPLPPTMYALRWYTYLLQQGKDDEFLRLDERLRAICPKTKTEVKELLPPRAFAELAVGRYAAAAKSLEICVQEKLWNEMVSEVMITSALARSLGSSGKRSDAIKLYRRAVQLSGVDPGLLSEFLCLVLEEEGFPGLLRELPAFSQGRVNLDVRLNASLSCFNSWLFLAGGDEKTAFEFLVQACPYFLLSSQQPAFSGDEGLACGVMLQLISEKLADPKRQAVATEYLKRFSADQINSMRKKFVLPKSK
jgi:serine/threonine protein kinase/Tfp pilus assembly protein PilF